MLVANVSLEGRFRCHRVLLVAGMLPGMPGRGPRKLSGPRTPSDVVGIREICEETGDTPNLIRWHLWAGHLPEPDLRIGRSPAWYWSTIRPWVEARNRR